ncbi:hypothetical protein TNCT_718351 [Trichonephila clavata]|uniref:Uncharacterized protein n=1 Tax=Trichonephila clavata TaxID=2740835 RepID=A0A8X6KPR1_TRICU|nr:hypothetical protein TNCT_718351 [Trichonephila clavata]
MWPGKWKNIAGEKEAPDWLVGMVVSSDWVAGSGGRNSLVRVHGFLWVESRMETAHCDLRVRIYKNPLYSLY